MTKQFWSIRFHYGKCPKISNTLVIRDWNSQNACQNREDPDQTVSTKQSDLGLCSLSRSFRQVIECLKLNLEYLP